MPGEPLVGIIMGSKSDSEAMQSCTDTLEEFGVPYELIIASAHRAPEKVAEWSKGAAARGMKVIIGAAGKAAALPGVVAIVTGADLARHTRPMVAGLKIAVENWPMAVERVRYVGEPVAIAIADC